MNPMNAPKGINRPVAGHARGRTLIGQLVREMAPFPARAVGMHPCSP